MSFYAAYRALGVKGALRLIVVGALSALLIGWAAPRLVAMIPTEEIVLYKKELRFSTEPPEIAFGASPPCHRAVFSSHLLGRFDAPRELKVSETDSVMLRVKLMSELVRICKQKGVPSEVRTLKAKAALHSPAFDITPSSNEIALEKVDVLEWTWLVKPKLAGRHAITLQATGERGLRINFREILRDVPDIKMTGDSLIANIEVLTELGFTATQHAWFVAIGAVAGFFAVILGFPFFAKFFQKRNSKHDQGHDA